MIRIVPSANWSLFAEHISLDNVQNWCIQEGVFRILWSGSFLSLCVQKCFEHNLQKCHVNGIVQDFRCLSPSPFSLLPLPSFPSPFLPFSPMLIASHVFPFPPSPLPFSPSPSLLSPFFLHLAHCFTWFSYSLSPMHLPPIPCSHTPISSPWTLHFLSTSLFSIPFHIPCFFSPFSHCLSSIPPQFPILYPIFAHTCFPFVFIILPSPKTSSHVLFFSSWSHWSIFIFQVIWYLGVCVGGQPATQSINQSINQSICLSLCFCLSVSGCVWLCLAVPVCVCLSLCVSHYMYVPVSVWVCLFVCLFVYQSVCLFACLFANMFVWQ